MNAQSRMLLVLVGADRFRAGTGFEEQPAFSRSAARFKTHMQGRAIARIPESNTLDLFNDESHAVAMVQRLETWLESKNSASWDVLIFYYVGHGMFHPPANDFFMAIRDTTPRYLYQSSLQMSCLAVALDTWVRTKLVVMILDCCYAGAAKVTLMSSTSQAAHNANKFTAVIGAEPRGLTQLCAAGKDYAAYVLNGAEYTMFTDALAYVLDHGLEEAGEFLSITDMAAGVRDRIRKLYPQEAVDPVVNMSHTQGAWSNSLPIFPNPAYISRTLEPISVETSTRAGSEEPTSGLRRDWFEEEEIEATVVLSEDFNERLEQAQTLGVKQIFQLDRQRHWLVCSHTCLYHVIDNLVERAPLVNWSVDLLVSAQRKPKIDMKPLLVRKRVRKILLGGHVAFVSANLFDSQDIVGSLKRWMKHCIRVDQVSGAAAANDRAILQRVERYLTSRSGTMPEALGPALTLEASSWAACASMLLARRERLFGRSTPERLRLKPIFEALCARHEEPNSHRYWSQLAYLESGAEKIRLCTTAIEFRNRTGSSKYRRYELTRASSRISSDAAFQQGRPSDPALVRLILADLHATQHLLDNRETPTDKRDRQRWQAINGIRDEDIAKVPVSNVQRQVTTSEASPRSRSFPAPGRVGASKERGELPLTERFVRPDRG